MFSPASDNVSTGFKCRKLYARGSNPMLPIVSKKWCDGKDESSFCYLRVSDVYIHESCCLGVQRHLSLPMRNAVGFRMALKQI